MAPLGRQRGRPRRHDSHRAIPLHAAIREDGGIGSRALHGLRKVGGDSIVVPVLKIHLGHPRH
ncbi:hypothetical protein QP162_17225 [Sphingomonas aurantiaca]|uniref:hypothetical protein n=1 Tax=Sphingomonas aurantiaca TaxID=185949 RepID=UPI002FDF9F0B